MEKMTTLKWLNGAGYTREEAADVFEIGTADDDCLAEIEADWTIEAAAQNGIELTDAETFLRETRDLFREANR